MKNVFAISALVLAATNSVFGQDSASLSLTDALATSSAAPSDSSSIASDSLIPTSTSAAADSTSAADSASLTSSGSVAPSSSSAALAVNLVTTASSSANPVPTGSSVSANCTAFLNTLDTDAQFASCTKPLLDATTAFAPSANAASVSASTLTATLDKLCAAPGCSDSYVRTQLTKFYAACKKELTGSTAVDSVKDTYDILYVMQPMKESICAKNSGTYCVLTTSSTSSASASASSSSTTTGSAGVQNLVAVAAATAESDGQVISDAVDTFLQKGVVKTGTVQRRAAKTNTTTTDSDNGQTVIYAPNTQVYHDTGVMYLFALPSLSKDAFCTDCTSKVLQAYAAWESKTPYGAGLTASPMLGDQAALWSAASSKCGSSYVAAVQSAAGAEAKAEANSASPAASMGLGGLATMFVALLSVWVAL